MKNKFLFLLSLVLVLLILISTASFGVSASGDFVIKDGVLTEYKGNDKNIVIPADVYYIADSVFINNKSIESVDLNNVTIIGNEAFRGCTALKKVTEYDSITSCGAYAFFGTSFQNSYSGNELILGSVLVHSKASGSYIIPSSVKSVAPYAFLGNEDITSVTIGQSIASVGEGAFYSCKNLKTVSCSTDVNYIGAFAFEGTKYLSSVTDEFLTLGNGILVKSNSTKTEVTIPSNVKQISAGAFLNNTKVTKVTLHDSVSGIGMRAFAGCTSLKEINLPSGLLLLDKEAFSGCKALADITIPASVQLLGDSVFFGCEGLRTASCFADSDISRGLFANCTSLEYVMVSSSATSVSELAFYNCTSLKELSLPGTVNNIADSAFSNCKKISVWTDSKSNTASILKALKINTYEIGDANCDGNFNIKDATEIQKAVAGMINFDLSSTLKSDTDFNSVVNIRDATWIQKRLAGIL